MHYGIEGRSALVVGGSKEIGFEAAKMLAAEGARVAVMARTKSDVDATVETIRSDGGTAMKEAGWGRFVHTGSATAKEPAGNIHHAVANTSRPSTVELLKTVSDEYARYGITVNTVPPGWIETENAVAYLNQHLGASTEQERRDFMLTQARVPAARMGTPREIAPLIVYLYSEPAGYLTGSWIEVDGGLHRSAF